ncbi:Golgi apparatus membrane protein tvp18 [Mucor ambiguus]|uniref:Golgi apparatus membrane protein tvp18 n=1 Tax=Mucor ambiguus TaxID=91626 RepID=A0A0C9MBY9_9FUNG|nr:Golgi apparatus membrane protein tvp18 [Mucor ambiguus]
MGFLDELKSRNFSLYAQWLGVISIACKDSYQVLPSMNINQEFLLVLIALGVVTLTSNPIFAIIGWVIAFILFFVEVPLCTKFCPTSPRFDSFIARFENAYFRGAVYIIFSVVMFLSTIINTTVLVVPAVTLLLTFISYGKFRSDAVMHPHELTQCLGFIVIAALKKQPYASTKILGGTGVDNVV